MNILIVFTGGTIGSTAENGVVSLNPEAVNRLFENNLKADSYGANINFTCIEPYRILSENLSAGNINRLILCIREALQNEFDGIIITHGTDTLQYTAAALSLAFAESRVPIVFVSANYPLDDKKSNGLQNFETAVEFIKSKPCGGVFVSYKNSGENPRIHCGDLLLLHQEGTDEIRSLSNNYFAEYHSGKIALNKSFKPSGNKKAPDFTLIENPGIITAISCPGSSYSYNLSECRAIIFMPYHSGTLNTADCNLKKLCAEAKSLGIPVFAVNAPPENIYESAKLFGELGIISLPNSAFAGTFVKVWVAISCNYNIADFVKSHN